MLTNALCYNYISSFKRDNAMFVVVSFFTFEVQLKFKRNMSQKINQLQITVSKIDNFNIINKTKQI